MESNPQQKISEGGTLYGKLPYGGVVEVGRIQSESMRKDLIQKGKAAGLKVIVCGYDLIYEPIEEEED